MKHFRMPHAVAGVIALAAALGLVRHEREAERKTPARMSIVVRDLPQSVNDSSGNLRPFAIDSETGQVYFVEITNNGRAGDFRTGARNHLPVARPSSGSPMLKA